MIMACNNQTEDSISISKFVKLVLNHTLNKIVNLILEMHEEKNLLIIKEVKKNDKSL